MKISGSAQLAAPPEKVWDALLSPEVLVRTIPGCERLEAIGNNSYAMTVTAGVASIKGTYKGTVELSDLDPHSSLTMHAEGSGAPGTIGVDVGVQFTPGADNTTEVKYEADAVVGGMIGGVGQRMLTSVSKRMAGEFFGAVNNVLTGAESPAPAPTTESDTEVGTAVDTPGEGAGTPRAVTVPAASAAAGNNDFVKGVLIGAVVMLTGVVTGALTARRQGGAA